MSVENKVSHFFFNFRWFFKTIYIRIKIVLAYLEFKIKLRVLISKIKKYIYKLQGYKYYYGKSYNIELNDPLYSVFNTNNILSFREMIFRRSLKDAICKNLFLLAGTSNEFVELLALCKEQPKSYKFILWQKNK